MGGLLWDMLSEFWQLTYIRMFDRGNQLTPLVHPQTDSYILCQCLLHWAKQYHMVILFPVYLHFRLPSQL